MSHEFTESELRALEELKRASSSDGSIFRDFYCCSDLALAWIDEYPGTDTTTAQQREFYASLATAYGAMDAIVNLLYRINLLTKSDRGFLSMEDLLDFFGTDVYTFHLLFGTLLDSSCKMIRVLSHEPELIPLGTFQELRKWCIDDTVKSSELISSGLCSLIVAADWFPVISDLIDELRQSQSVVIVGIYEPPREFHFFTWRNRIPKKNAVPEQLKYGGMILFRPYVGYYLGRAMFLLNEVCVSAVTKLGISYFDEKISRPRLGEIRKCIDCAIDSLETGRFDMTPLCQ